jgi:hypothetical protein
MEKYSLCKIKLPQWATVEVSDILIAIDGIHVWLVAAFLSTLQMQFLTTDSTVANLY